MPPFVILTSLDSNFQLEVEIAIRSFAKFYYNVTNKHRNRIHLVIIDRGGQQKKEFCRLAEKYNISNSVRIISKYSKDSLKKALHHASLLFLPTSDSSQELISNALSNALPILSFDVFSLRKFIDNSCGLLFRFNSPEQSISTFSDMMRMLYFDPEALKMLRKGALKKYKTIFSWKQKQESEELSQIVHNPEVVRCELRPVI